jgi:prepilin signal peptidase PulO-like enzyme (type II secretory pathway)
MRQYARDITADIPGYGESTRRLRSEHSVAVGRALLIAAAVCVIRAAVVPWYLYYYPSKTGFTDLEIVTTSVLLACVFAMASLCSRVAAFGAVMISIACFGAICTRDYMSYPDLLAQGLFSKTLIFIMLTRGLLSALMSRMM